VVEKNFDVSFLGGPLLSLQVPASHGDVAQERARVAGRPLFAQDSLVRGPGFDRGGRRALKQALPKGGLDPVLGIRMFLGLQGSGSGSISQRYGFRILPLIPDPSLL
jgi:hypothetical protein